MSKYEFVKSLKKYPLTSQQRHTLKGQALSGDLDGAMKGLQKCLAKNNFK